MQDIAATQQASMNQLSEKAATMSPSIQPQRSQAAHLPPRASSPGHSAEFSAGLLPAASRLLPDSSGLAHTCSGRERPRPAMVCIWFEFVHEFLCWGTGPRGGHVKRWGLAGVLRSLRACPLEPISLGGTTGLFLQEGCCKRSQPEPRPCPRLSV